MPVKIDFPPSVDNDGHGFAFLGSLARAVKEGSGDGVVLNLKNLQFFAANLCAPLGAIVDCARRDGVQVEFHDPQGPVLSIWRKNGFGILLGATPAEDTYRTTLSYRSFCLEDSRRDFAKYIDEELMVRERDLPDMSDEVRRGFATGIQEIFDNAQVHSESLDGIFSCGQLFPSRDRLSFTIVDVGVGFAATIHRRWGYRLNDPQAIEWAVETGHSSRPREGGYGLATIRDFLNVNGGRIQIVSHGGFWEFRDGAGGSEALRTAFPGCLVNIEINTMDTGRHEVAQSQRPTSFF